MGCGASSTSVVRASDTVELVLDDFQPGGKSAQLLRPSGASAFSTPQETEIDRSDLDLSAVPDLRQYLLLQRLLLDRNQFRVFDVGGVPPNVQFLSAQSCRITALNESIADLTALRTINLTDNLLETLPGLFGKLDNLTVLNLSRNHLAVIPACVFQLRALRTLDVSHNALDAIPSGIRHLTALSELFASNNVLTSVCNEIGSLRVLTRCDLSSNRLTMLPTSIAQLTALVFLDTHNNPFSLSGLRLEDASADRVRKVIESSACLLRVVPGVPFLRQTCLRRLHGTGRERADPGGRHAAPAGRRAAC
jgi:Leucine-rich repeat (LRR) protein